MHSAFEVLGIAASESEFDLQSIFQVILIVSDSHPHTTDMGGMESEPALGRYSANTLQFCLGFRFLRRGPI